jgi:FMN-dependent NADH-azoreductase
MYVLAKKAFQKQDNRLMPSDETLATNISSRLKPFIDNIVKKEITFS